MSETRKSTVGDPIWVESLMTKDEWRQRCKDYPATSTEPYPKDMFECDFKWRYGIGASIPQKEIDIINKRMSNLAEVLKRIKDGEQRSVAVS